jgi:iron complex transport system permease protein
LKKRTILISLSIVLFILFVLGLSLGSVEIPLKSLLGLEELSESHKMIIDKIRVPRNLTAILSGSGLALSGLLLQTVFRNPLAGPSILGITSGSSLGVGIVMLSGASLGISIGSGGILLSAIIGALVVLFIISMISVKFEDITLVLIAGLMLGFLASSILSILAFFANAEVLKPFVHWGFGSFARLSPGQIPVLFITLVFGIGLSIFSYKALNAFLLGEDFARSLGINVRLSRLLIIIVTGVVTGVITAYAGPVAFIGLAVPQLVKLVFKSNHHKITLPATILLGAIVALSCDIISRVPGSEIALPLNAITSLFGAPIVLWILFRSKKVKNRIV